MRVGDPVFRLNYRVVNLRNADEKDAVSGANDQRAPVAQRVCQPGAWGEIVWLKWHFAGRREQRIREQPLGGEGLKIPTNSQIHREMIGQAHRVLREGGIFIGIRMRYGAAKIVQVVMRHLVRVGPQRGELKRSHLRFEGERIDLDGIEEIFAALLAREEIKNLGDERIAAELQRVAGAFYADRVREMHAVLAGFAWQHAGPADGVENGRNLDQDVAAVGIRLLAVARELRSKMAEPAHAETAGQGKVHGFCCNQLLAVVADGV